MLYWIIVGIAWVVGAILFAVIGVLATRRMVRVHVREGHNDVLVPLFLTAGVIYAVLLAFMVIAMWETYDNAKANVAEEASLLVPMYRQAEDFSPDTSVVMHQLIRDYAEGVLDQWDRFTKTALGSTSARITVDNMIYLFGTMVPATASRQIVDTQFFATFSQLMEDRNKRLLQASESLSWIMWVAAIGGGVVTVGMAFVLYMDKPAPQVVMVSVLSALIGTLLFIMMVLDKPFLGPMAIAPEPFEATLSLLKQIDGDFNAINAHQGIIDPKSIPETAPAASAGESKGESNAH